MSTVNIKIQGLDKALARLDIKKYEPQIQQCFDKFGLRVELEAKQRAPVDEGHLKGSIFQQPGRLSSTVGCSVDYAAYLEFGTRKFAASYVASLPQDWQTLAASKRGGGGGSFEEFVQRLTLWVIRKGIAATPTKSGAASKSKSAINAQHNAAYAIARSILRNGIKAQPYLYPAFNLAKEDLIKQLKEIKV